MDNQIKKKGFIPALIADILGMVLMVVGIMESGSPTGWILPNIPWRFEISMGMIVIGLVLWWPMIAFLRKQSKENNRQ